MDDLIELGTVSSRGQLCIPTNIRAQMGLEEGSRVLFLLSSDALVVKKVSSQTFAEITAPLKAEMKKSGMKEGDVPALISKVRSRK